MERVEVQGVGVEGVEVERMEVEVTSEDETSATSFEVDSFLGLLHPEHLHIIDCYSNCTITIEKHVVHTSCPHIYLQGKPVRALSTYLL